VNCKDRILPARSSFTRPMGIYLQGRNVSVKRRSIEVKIRDLRHDLSRHVNPWVRGSISAPVGRLELVPLLFAFEPVWCRIVEDYL